MRATKKLVLAVFLAFAVLALSLYFEFIPCQTAPMTVNPQYQWKFCSQNPDVNQGNIERKYFGYTSSLTESYSITLILSFIAALLLISLITKSHKKE